MKNLLEKIRHNHMLLMIVCCVVPIAIVFIGITFLSWGNKWLTYGILLLCPLAHIFMMKDHMKMKKNTQATIKKGKKENVR